MKRQMMGGKKGNLLRGATATGEKSTETVAKRYLPGQTRRREASRKLPFQNRNKSSSENGLPVEIP